jgi:hypothetical protein
MQFSPFSCLILLGWIKVVLLIRVKNVFRYSIIKMETNNPEQRHAIEFCGGGEYYRSDTYEKILKAFGAPRAPLFRLTKRAEDGPRPLREEAQASAVSGLSFVKIDV